MVLLSYTQLSIDLHLNLEFFTVSLKNVGYLFNFIHIEVF